MSDHGSVGPSGPLKVSITHVNATAGYRYGEHVEDVVGDAVSEVFASMKRQYGGHISRVYRDTKDGPAHVGWTFSRRVGYEDQGTYLRETWVTFHRDARCACCGTVSGRWSVTVEEARGLLTAAA